MQEFDEYKCLPRCISRILKEEVWHGKTPEWQREFVAQRLRIIEDFIEPLTDPVTGNRRFSEFCSRIFEADSLPNTLRALGWPRFEDGVDIYLGMWSFAEQKLAAGDSVSALALAAWTLTNPYLDRVDFDADVLATATTAMLCLDSEFSEIALHAWSVWLGIPGTVSSESFIAALPDSRFMEVRSSVSRLRIIRSVGLLLSYLDGFPSATRLYESWLGLDDTSAYRSEESIARLMCRSPLVELATSGRWAPFEQREVSIFLYLLSEALQHPRLCGTNDKLK